MLWNDELLKEARLKLWKRYHVHMHKYREAIFNPNISYMTGRQMNVWSKTQKSYKVARLS